MIRIFVNVFSNGHRTTIITHMVLIGIFMFSKTTFSTIIANMIYDNNIRMLAHVLTTFIITTMIFVFISMIQYIICITINTSSCVRFRRNNPF